MLKRSVNIFTLFSISLLYLSQPAASQSNISGESERRNTPIEEQQQSSSTVNGSWAGTMTQNHEPRMWNIRILISQEGQHLEGTTLKEPVNDELVSVLHEFTGTISDSALTFQEVRIVERNASPGWEFCNISGQLELHFSNGRESLQGSWECVYEGERHFGEIFLSREVAQNPSVPSQLELLNGTWEGTYSCMQGLTNLRLRIDARSADEVDAVFMFSAHPNNPSVPSGSFRMEGTYAGGNSQGTTGLLELIGTTWLDRPSEYLTVDLIGNVLATEGRITGEVSSPGCTSFDLVRIDEGGGERRSQTGSSQSQTSSPRTLITPNNTQMNQGNSSGASDTPTSGVSNTPLTSEADEQEMIVRETRRELTVEVQYNNPQRCNQLRQDITVKITRRSNPDRPDTYGFSGVNSFRIPGCFERANIVNLDSDEEHEVVIDFTHFDGRSIGTIIFDSLPGCATCNTQPPPIAATFPTGYRLEDLDKPGDGALEFISNGFPVEIKQLRNQTLVDGEPLLIARETARRLREEYPGWRDRLDNCPCTKAEAEANPRFEDATHALTDIYHPGARSEYRSTEDAVRPYASPTIPEAPTLMPGQQCTYDAEGKLITDGAGAGTPDAYSPSVTYVGQGVVSNNSHTFWDVNPFNADGMTSEEYRQTWTPNNGNVCSINIRDWAVLEAGIKLPHTWPFSSSKG